MDQSIAKYHLSFEKDIYTFYNKKYQVNVPDVGLVITEISLYGVQKSYLVTKTFKNKRGEVIKFTVVPVKEYNSEFVITDDVPLNIVQAKNNEGRWSWEKSDELGIFYFGRLKEEDINLYNNT